MSRDVEGFIGSNGTFFGSGFSECSVLEFSAACVPGALEIRAQDVA